MFFFLFAVIRKLCYGRNRYDGLSQGTRQLDLQHYYRRSCSSCTRHLQAAHELVILLSFTILSLVRA